MEIKKNLPLQGVEFTDEGKKAILYFVDEEAGEMFEVNFNKQAYDRITNKFVDDPEKALFIEDSCREYFGVSFENLEQAIGQVKDVYAYEKFNTLWEIARIERPTDDMHGEIYTVEVTEVFANDVGIHIRFEIDGKTYQSRMTYAKYDEAMKRWFTQPTRRAQQYEKFQEKFGISVDDADKMIGKEVMVEVKKAFGTVLYFEVKKKQIK